MCKPFAYGNSASDSIWTSWRAPAKLVDSHGDGAGFGFFQETLHLLDGFFPRESVQVDTELCIQAQPADFFAGGGFVFGEKAR